MLDLIHKGGYTMYPILFCSILGLTIFLERFCFFIRNRFPKQQRLDNCFERIQQKNKTEALSSFDVESYFYSFFKDIIEETTEKLSSERATISAEKILFSFGRRIPILNFFASLTPLLGLLGTVIGMIQAFAAVAKAGSVSNIALLAGGIWEALLSTAAGLTVGIPLLIGYHILNRKHETLAHKLQQTGNQIILLMNKNKLFEE